MNSNSTTKTLAAVACLVVTPLAAAGSSVGFQTLGPQAVRANPAPSTASRTALLTLISQSRSIHTDAYADPWGDQYSAQAAGFGRFNHLGQAFASSAEGYAGATAWQDSRIQGDAIVATGGASAEGWFFGSGFGSSGGFSSLEVRFSVAEPVTYHVTGSIYGLYWGNSKVELLDDNLASLFVVEASGGNAPFKKCGVLSPGEYVLRVDAYASGGGSGGSWSSNASYDLTFDAALVHGQPLPQTPTRAR
jgi:hypothetical protein